MGYNKKNNNNSDKKKQSGCKLHNHLDSEKGLFMSVWKVEKGVMWSGKITMTPSQIKTGIRVSKSGKKWVSVLLRMNAPMHNQVAVTGMMNVDSQKVYFKDWNTMANPRANNGGYYGKHISKNYN
ncbi:hypothetical protein [Tenacibaculum ovolyticum]|uniref:hypothetical protein n=1 Tax=Tenacibaculum ovolyticum TaxID=104270 RepID=UPI003BAA4DAB